MSSCHFKPRGNGPIFRVDGNGREQGGPCPFRQRVARMAAGKKPNGRKEQWHHVCTACLQDAVPSHLCSSRSKYQDSPDSDFILGAPAFLQAFQSCIYFSAFVCGGLSLTRTHSEWRYLTLRILRTAATMVFEPPAWVPKLPFGMSPK